MKTIESGDRISPAPAYPAAAEGVEEEKLVLFSACAKRPQDPLAFSMKRVVEHNKIVADHVQKMCENDGAGVIKYVSEGAVVAFAPDRVESALRCCLAIMKELESKDDVPGDEPIVTRVGFSFGKLESIPYPGSAVPDESGLPIEIALKLVSDIAQPSQIVVDLDAKKKMFAAVDMLNEDEEGKYSDLELLPMKGEKLRIDGVTRPIPVFELVWDGTERKIKNRRLLMRELTAMQQAVTGVRIRISEMRRDLRNPSTVKDGIEVIESGIRALRDPGVGLRLLKDVWRDSHELKKDTRLEGAKDRVVEAYDLLVETWRKEKDHLRLPESPVGESSVRVYEDVYEAFRNAILDLDRDVGDRIEEVGELP